MIQFRCPSADVFLTKGFTDGIPRSAHGEIYMCETFETRVLSGIKVGYFY
jgi:hypothetical protein